MTSTTSLDEVLPAVVDESFFRDRDWCATSPPLRGLDHRFRVRCAAPGLDDWLQETFRDLVDPAPSTDGQVQYSIVLGTDDLGQTRYALYADLERVVASRTLARSVEMLLWHINQTVVARSGDGWLLLHAAGATRDGVTVVLPAASESGKTTTVAGLFVRGYSYLTDEVVALSNDDLTVRPFPKALAVDRGSWRLLPSLEPEHVPVLGQWQVPAGRHGRTAPLAPAQRPTLVVSPRYDASGPTHAQRLRKSEALLLLAQCAFGFEDRARELLPVLARLAEATPAYVLHIAELEPALDIVDALVEEWAGGSAS